MRLLSCVLCLLALPAFSETIVVKSGEHGPFTRLAIRFQNSPVWQLGRTEIGYELKVQGDDVRFDLSEVYRLIDRTRLKSIWVDPVTGVLQLGIGCPCHVTAEIVQQNVLALDIRDGLPGKDARHENTLSGVAQPPLGEVTQPRPRRRPILPEERELQSAYDWTSIPAREVSDEGPGTPENLATEQDFGDFRKSLVEQLAKSGTEGRVLLVPTVLGGDLERSGQAQPADNVALGTDPIVSDDGSRCIDPARLEVSDWGSPAENYAQLATSLAGVLGEFDQVDEDALQQAVKGRLYLGLGAEARALMHQFQGSSAPDPLMIELSYLVEGEAGQGGLLEGQQSCEGSAALWALVALDGTPIHAKINAKAVVQEFMNLPDYLKSVLAADLARKLQEANHRSEAQTILNQLSLSGQQMEAVAPIVASELALGQDQPDAAIKELNREFPETRRAEALILRAEAEFMRKGSLGAKELLELEAISFTGLAGRGEPRLQSALAKAKAMAGDFDMAFHLSDDIDTRRDIWGRLAEMGSDDALMRMVAQAGDSAPETVPPEVRLKVVDRLIDIGLPALASGWAPARSENRELEAEVAISLNEGAVALDVLKGMESEKADDLRLRALLNVRNYEEAVGAVLGEQPSTELDRLRRWAGTWEPGATDSADDWTEVARLGETAESLAPATLANARNILQKTTDTEASIRLLLKATEEAARE